VPVAWAWVVVAILFCFDVFFIFSPQRGLEFQLVLASFRYFFLFSFALLMICVTIMKHRNIHFAPRYSLFAAWHYSALLLGTARRCSTLLDARRRK
jgi:hypothetical protein